MGDDKKQTKESGKRKYRGRIEKFAVTAIQPAPNFLLLVEVIAEGFNGDLDWASDCAIHLGSRD